MSNKKRTSINSVKKPLAVALTTSIIAGCSSSLPQKKITTNTVKPALQIKELTPTTLNSLNVNQPLLSMDQNSFAQNPQMDNTQPFIGTPRINSQATGVWKSFATGRQLVPSRSASSAQVQTEIQLQKKVLLEQKKQIFVDSLQKSRPFIHYTLNEAKRRGLPTALALAPIVLSNYNPKKQNPNGAAGLWQITPAVANQLGLPMDKTYDGRLDIISSTNATYDYLAKLHEKYQGSWELALAAYKESPMAVDYAINENKSYGKPTDFWSLKLSPSTKAFVPQIFAMSEIIKNPNYHAINVPNIPDRKAFHVVNVHSGVFLKEVADIANVPLDSIKELNFGLRIGRIDTFSPEKRILVPTGVSSKQLNMIANLHKKQPEDDFNQNYTASHAPTPVKKRKNNRKKVRNSTSKKYHIVRRGETLFGLAKKLGINRELLAQYNNVDTEYRLIEGKKLWLVDTRKSNNPRQKPSKKKPLNNRSHRNMQANNRYKVKKGDTLLGIANRMGVSGSSIASLNGFDIEYLVKTGESIKIPSRTETSNNYQTATSIKYKVSKNESLTSVSKKFGISKHALAKVNNLTIESHLINGNYIVIPKNDTQVKTNIKPFQPTWIKVVGKKEYKIQKGDSLSKLARKYKTSVSVLAKLNGYSTEERLRADEYMKLPIISQVYKVRPGDGLIKLAKKIGVDVERLAEANKLSRTASLRIGQNLLIPTR